MQVNLETLKLLLETREKTFLLNGYIYPVKQVKRLFKSLNKGMSISVIQSGIYLTVEYVNSAVDGKFSFVGSKVV